MKTTDFKRRLVGGTTADRAEAVKWIALFMESTRVGGLSDVEWAELRAGG